MITREPPPRRFYTLPEVAGMFSTSVIQVRALIRRGDLRAIQIGGRSQWRIEQAEIDAYVERAYQAGAASRGTPGEPEHQAHPATPERSVTDGGDGSDKSDSR